MEGSRYRCGIGDGFLLWQNLIADFLKNTC
jgi:hypothetical protein